MRHSRGRLLGEPYLSEITLSKIDQRLKQLVALWIDGTPDSLRHVPVLCEEMLLLARNEGKLNMDQNLLHHVGRLAAKADGRLAVCLEIQSRTGSYSVRGALELTPRIATAGWEG
jgi:hypothetical protein